MTETTTVHVKAAEESGVASTEDSAATKTAGEEQAPAEPKQQAAPPASVVDDLKMLAKFSVNLIFMSIAFVLMKSTDTAFIGHLGTDYLVAASTADLWTLAVGVILQGSVLQVFVGNAVGAENFHLAGVWLNVSLCVLGPITIVVMGLWCLTGPLLLLFGVEGSVASDAGYYAIVTSFCLPFRLLHAQVSKLFEGQGIMTAMLPSMLAGSITNFVLGLVFGLGIPIAALGFGYEAIPIGTIGGEIAQVLVVVGWFCGVKKLHAKCYDGFALSEVTRARMTAFLKLYVPEVASLASDCIRMSLVGVLAAVVGDTQLAVFQVAYRILWMGLIIVFAIGIAQGIMMSIFLGMKDAARAKRIAKLGLAINVTFLLVFGAVFVIFARSFGTIFSSDDVFLDMFEEQRLPIAATLFFMNLSVGIERILMALGMTRSVFWSGAVGSWVGQVPCVVVLTLVDRHIRMVLWGIALGYLLLVVIQIVILSRVDWQSRVKDARQRAEVEDGETTEKDAEVAEGGGVK